MLPFRKILCPTDFSDPAAKAIAAAGDLATHFSAELCLLHVVSPIPVPMTENGDLSPAFDIPSYENHLDASAKQSIHETAARLLPKDLAVTPLVGQGDAADEIVRIAKEQNVDLIVIATHGMTGWRHLIFGSVAEKVVRLSPCPVLTIRAPEKKE